MSRKTRKLIWSVPLVATLAIVGALALFVALTPNDASAQADTAPGRPGTLEAVAFADGTPETEILLTWSAPTTGGSPTHYRIDVSTNGGNTWTALRSNVNDTRFLHTGLKAGETYHYQVFAVSGQLVSPKSNSSTATTAPVVDPEKPDNLVATIQTVISNEDPPIADSEGELTIELEWTAPPDPAGAPVLGYVVQYALIETPTSWTELKETDPEFEFTDVTAAEHSMLDAGRTYRYQVAAYNQTMEVGGKTVYDPNSLSKWASPDAATTLDGAAPPEITAATVRVGVSPAVPKIFLYWPPPDDPLGDPVNAYKVEGRPTTKPDGSNLNYDNSDEIADDTVCGPANAAGTPPTEGCPFVAIKDNIGRPNGTFIHSFEVTVNDVNRNTRYDKYFTTMANWEYRIRAKNRSTPEGTETDEDVTVERSTSNGETLTQFLRLPASLRVDPSEDAAHHEGRTGLALTWNKSQTNQAAPADATHYRIEYSNTGPSDPGGYDWRRLGTDNSFPADPAADEAKQTGSDNAAVTHQLATGQAEMDENLAAGQTRHYRVFALAAQANQIMSWPSDQRSGTTANAEKPDPPTGLTATAASHTSIVLAWTPPDGDGTTSPLDDMDGSEEGPSVIAGYYIQYLEDGASNWAHIQKDGSNLITDAKGEPDVKYTHEGLAPGSSREYRMAAVNKISSSEQRSDWTELVKGSTVQIPLPNAVAGLVVEATGQNTIDMTWLAQAEQPEDAEVTEYIIEQSPDGKEGTFTMLTSVTMMTEDDVHTIHVDTGLSPNTERHYRVYAKNARGRSDQVSNVASATTSERMNTAPTAGAAIAGQTVMVDATVMVQSTITDADTDDTLTWSAMSNMPTYATATVDNMGMVTITGVAEGMATITVTATDSMGAMATQEIMVTVTVEAAEPEEVGPATGVTTGPFNEGGVIQVNWDAAPNATGYIIYAVNVDELDDADGQIVVAPVNDAAAETFNLGGLNSGDTYDIYVVATAKEMVAWPAAADVVQVDAE